MDLPLLRLIDRAKEFVGSQLREFMSLDKRTGKFDTVPEYPEFAWLEGIVNANLCKGLHKQAYVKNCVMSRKAKAA